MSDLMLEREGSADERVTSWARWLAERSPRRSFLGKAGRGLVASSVGGTAALALFAESAYAGGCGCYGSESVTCGCLTGANTCPSGTCQCGCWTTCSAFCTGCNNTNWCDCCNQTAHSSYCVSSCGTAPGRPSNCFSKEWSGGCSTGHSIRCRYYYCSSFGVHCC